MRAKFIVNCPFLTELRDFAVRPEWIRPRKGESVMIHSTLYRVDSIIHCYDGDEDYVHYYLEEK